MNDLISRQAAIDALAGMIDRFERILADIRETKVDDSVCGMCEYDGAYIGQSGDWCNECPGFEKNDCFKLSDECRKRWLESVKLPSAQPATNCSEFPNNSDVVGMQDDAISRQAAIEAIKKHYRAHDNDLLELIAFDIEQLPSAQPEIIRCRNCKFASGDSRICMQFGHSPIGELDFCAWAERRTDE